MITEDYIIRMIRDMGRMVARLLHLETENPYISQEVQKLEFADQPPMAERLKQLADQGEINRAEDLLFEELDFSNPQDFPAALDFYEHLNGFSDTRLEACGYSREEIFEGLRDCAENFGVDKNLLEAFHP